MAYQRSEEKNQHQNLFNINTNIMYKRRLSYFCWGIGKMYISQRLNLLSTVDLSPEKHRIIHEFRARKYGSV